MFGHRCDGRKIKGISPLFKIIPCLMKERSDSQVFFKQDIVLGPLDEYMNKKAEEGLRLSYMHIIYAAMIRVLAERPCLNRFVMNGAIYSRNEYTIALVVKKSLSDEGEETTTKLRFKGTENIYDVKAMVDEIIEKNKDVETKNGTDKLVKILTSVPTCVIQFLVGCIKFFDKHGMLPKAIINLSPFHTSAFLTNVGSLGIDSIYHHIYNFGTTSMFFSMGKKKKSYVYEDDEIKEEKCITIAFVGDERICDGYYYANSFRQLQKYLKKPELLEEHPVPKEDIK